MDDNKQENLKIKKAEEENAVKAEEVKPAAQPTPSTEPKKENVLEIKVNNESVHNESLNINKNLGSFENSFNPSEDPIKQIDDEIVINEDSNRLGSLRETLLSSAELKENKDMLINLVQTILQLRLILD